VFCDVEEDIYVMLRGILWCFAVLKNAYVMLLDIIRCFAVLKKYM
jgi:hypothetical protein